MRNTGISAALLALLSMGLVATGCNSSSGSSTSSKSTAPMSTAKGTAPVVSGTGIAPTVSAMPAPVISKSLLTPGTNVSSTVSRWLYSANEGDDSVTQFSINATTGAITAVGTPVSIGTGSAPTCVCANPAGTFLFVLSTAGVQTYAISPTTGALTAVLSSPLSTSPFVGVVDPTGSFLLVANGDDTVNSYAIPATGILGAPMTVSLTAGSSALGIACDPTGKTCYTANFGTGDVTTISIEAGTGNLAIVTQSTLAGSGAGAISVDAAGKNVYVGNYTDSTMNQFTRDPATGLLSSPAAGVVTVSVPGAGSPNWLTMSPSGKFLYAACDPGSVVSFSVDPTTGALTALNPQATSGASPFAICLDASGTFGFTADFNNDSVSTFKTDATGNLNAVGNSTMVNAAGSSPFSVVCVK